MINNALSDFVINIFSYLIGDVHAKQTMLIKKHSENLTTYGDYSYPNTLKSWISYINCQKPGNDYCATFMEYIKKDTSHLIQESSHWILKLCRALEESDRIVLYLDRRQAIRVGLLQSVQNVVSILSDTDQKTTDVHLDPLCEDENCITSLRMQYLSDTIKNLYLMSKQHQKFQSPIFVTYKSSNKKPGSRTVICGTVLNSKTSLKETTITSNEFIRNRQNEMSLIAQHKYGLRVATDIKWREFIANLGESAVVFELLQIKPSSAVKINFDTVAGGSSKGASFVLYNCARLETIIRTYNQKVEEGIYPDLPDLQSIDFGLLTHEDEWSLVFNFILGFPLMLENCVEISETVCEFRPHLICSFLCSMVRVFSQYYRRVRILTPIYTVSIGI